MNIYKLKITKCTENTNYVEEKKEWDRQTLYNEAIGIPPEKYNEVSALEVELTDAQFVQVKLAVLEGWG